MLWKVTIENIKNINKKIILTESSTFTSIQKKKISKKCIIDEEKFIRKKRKERKQLFSYKRKKKETKNILEVFIITNLILSNRIFYL